MACSTVNTADAEVHGGLYTGLTEGVSFTTGTLIPTAAFDSVACIGSGYEYSESAVWECPTLGGVATVCVCVCVRVSVSV
jgi:hypothetical protein